MHLTWFGIARLGLVQAMLGAVVVLTTSTLNRVMVVELALPALVPGLLVALHYAVQLSRPRMGFGADVGRHRTRWIVGGLAVLATGGWLAALGVAWAASDRVAGLALCTVAFVMVGLGVSAAGTNLLTLLAKQVAPERRAAAAALVWTMMIFGFALTSGLAGKALDPYSPARLVQVSGTVSVVALLLACAALWRLEQRGDAASLQAPSSAMTVQRFRAALVEVWADGQARRFTVFVFVSMVAYSAQDLILEPFAGVMFGYTPGQSTQLAGVQHGGTLAGMLLAALAGRRLAGVGFGSLKTWTVGGCLASCVALAGLVFAGLGAAPLWPLKANVFLLGVANGAFSIAAIGSMMALAGGNAHSGQAPREGTRMGLWGAAQAIGFAGGGLIGAAASDVMRWWLGAPGPAYAAVFAAEALLFVAAARLASGLSATDSAVQPSLPPRAWSPGVAKEST
jgi:MFS transporter, BCD family, chlorophyll transporter